MQYSKELIDQLFQILNVFGVLGATFFAFFSAKYARDSVKLTKEQDNPCIVVYVRQSPSSIHVVELVIKNEGIRSARNIKFKIIKDNIDVSHKRKISDIEIIKNGIALLAGNKEIVQPLDVFLGEKYEKFKKADTMIDVSFTDNDKKEYKDTFSLDFKGLVDLSIGGDDERKTAKAIQGIHEELNDIKQDIHSIANNGIVGIIPKPYYPDNQFNVTEELRTKEK